MEATDSFLLRFVKKYCKKERGILIVRGKKKKKIVNLIHSIPTFVFYFRKFLTGGANDIKMTENDGIRGCGGALSGNRVFWLPVIIILLLCFGSFIHLEDNSDPAVAVVPTNAVVLKVPVKTPPPITPSFSYNEYPIDTQEGCEKVIREGIENTATIKLQNIDKLRTHFEESMRAGEHLRTCHISEKNRQKKRKGSLGISAKKRYWIDLGARAMDVTKNFNLQYPGASGFIKHTFEPNPSFSHLYKTHSDISHHQVAVSIVNDSLQLSNADVGSSIVKKASKSVAGPSMSVQSINWVDWLARTVTSDDFVVVKMDVEFCEFGIINLLLQSSAITLIDELLLECHYKTRKSRKYIPAEGEEEPISRTDCKNFVHLIELSGVVAINWSKVCFFFLSILGRKRW